ncbi:Cysteine-rich protein 1 [Cyphomyrmex costatus]|nr:Cysteine-rich protein 1 [Cyphomyrmex costatus]
MELYNDEQVTFARCLNIRGRGSRVFVQPLVLTHVNVHTLNQLESVALPCRVLRASTRLTTPLRASFCKSHNLVGEAGSSRHNEMPNCPKCDKPVYFAERKTSLGKDWHGSCLRCEKCNKTLTPGGHAEHEGKPYCNHPCYSALFGPGGFGRGGAESYVYNK